MPLTEDTVTFPTLDDAELAVLETLGIHRSVTVGEYLYREGDTTYDFYVIRSGAAQIVLRSDGEERIVARHGPGRFLGELNLLTGQGCICRRASLSLGRFSWCPGRRCNT
jgi:thioredoxin reductase (NADPH)